MKTVVIYLTFLVASPFAALLFVLKVANEMADVALDKVFE